MVRTINPEDREAMRAAMWAMRQRVDDGGIALRVKGEGILERLRQVSTGGGEVQSEPTAVAAGAFAFLSAGRGAIPYNGVASLVREGADPVGLGFFGALRRPIPYEEFKQRMTAGD